MKMPLKNKAKNIKKTSVKLKTKQAKPKVALSKEHIGAGTLLAPLPVSIISTGTPEKTNLMTVEWIGIVNTKPPMLSISVRPERFSYELLGQNPRFVVHALLTEQWHLADWVGTRSGRYEDQIGTYKGQGITMESLNDAYPQAIVGTPLCLLCSVERRILLGTHELFLANIDEVWVEPSLLNEQGKLQINDHDLLAYSHGAYRQVSKVVGVFGESRVKQKKLAGLKKRRL